MSFHFDPEDGLVVVSVEIGGPGGSAILRLALDTGATQTLVNAGPLLALGYDPALSPDRQQVTTGSGVEFVPSLTLKTIDALGRHLTDFPALCHTLPPSAGVDGLLGLDFFRGTRLSVDFIDGRITLEF